MSQRFDVWAATWNNDTASIRTAAAIATTTPLTFNKVVGVNGAGGLVTVTSSGDEDDTVFTITGLDMSGNTITEDITGVDTSTVTGTKYFSVVTSIENDTASVGNISYGLSGLALPKTRIKGIYFVGATSAGSLTVTRSSTSQQIYKAVSPAGSGAEAFNIVIPADGIPTSYTLGDYATITLSNVVSTTILCG